MNLKACTFGRLASISLGFGRGAQVGKTSLLEVNLYGSSVDVGRIHFYWLHLAYRRKSVCFSPFYEAKYLKKKHSKSTRKTHFFKMSQNSFI